MTRIVRRTMPCGRSEVMVHDARDRGNANMMTCGCGRAGWGLGGLVQAHTRPVARPAPLPTLTRQEREDLGIHWLWTPQYADRQERREGMQFRWWNSGHRAPVRRVGEVILCRWYGHQESQENPGTCYYCRKHRGKRGIWRPAPEHDPGMRPEEQVRIRKHNRTIYPHTHLPKADPVCGPHALPKCQYCARRSQ